MKIISSIFVKEDDRILIPWWEKVRDTPGCVPEEIVSVIEYERIEKEFSDEN